MYISDVWSDSQSTGLPDSDSGDEFMKLPQKLGPIASPIVCKVILKYVAIICCVEI